ncbi:terminase small subunit [Bacillus marasmi]|uniref:terminase small subunit n=1 Tax=Bacillus marasmi TaxID=1926279 RepID=UPI0011C98EE7|nr:terminase small subunit [Bacillus marasmi]
MAKLTEKQKRFVDEYLIDLNATRAYKAAYPRVKNDETASVNGSRMLRNAKVEKYINERMKAREKRTEITQDKVLKELAKIAFVNGADFAKVITKKTDSGGEYKQVEIADTDSLSENVKAAISGIKETKFGISVESYDKVKALELIGRHLGMFKDTLELSGNMNVNNPYEGLTTEELRELARSGKHE